MIFFFQVKIYTDLIDAKSSQKAEDNVSEKSDEEVAMPQGKMSKKKRNKLNKREAAKVRDEQARATAAEKQAEAEREKARAAGRKKEAARNIGEQRLQFEEATASAAEASEIDNRNAYDPHWVTDHSLARYFL